METTTLLLGVHGHQPAGNFRWVFGEAYARAYRPFLEVIERHPTLRWTVHLSGPLLEWLAEEQPEAVRRLAGLVRRGQVEVMGGGYAEPILPLLPARDALGQLQRLTRLLTTLKLGPCRGAWLAERVWEPSLPALFRAAGIEYTVVDDHHLRLAGFGEEAAFGYWVTEETGQTLALFPSSKALRYMVPFQPVEQVLDHLRGLRSHQERAVVLADDLEKFGLWPGTHRWVYEEGWLERFCQALEAESAWLKTYTFSQYQAACPPLGRVYVPCASYEEMLQWSNGHFRNFLTKYPEANTMHKKMLWVSQRLHEARGAVKGDAELHLYRGQGNDAYWHGVFGGIYLRHLRTATYHELLTAERLVDRAEHEAQAWMAAEANDLDADGQPDLLLRSGLMDCWIDPSRGGTIIEWDDKTRAFNLVNTLTRRPEPYHAKLSEPEPAAVGAVVVEGPQTIHGRVRATEPHLKGHLIYDRYRRVAAIDHLWPAERGTPQAFARGELEELEADAPAVPELKLWHRQRGKSSWRLERRPGGVRAVLAHERGALRLTKAVTLARRLPELTVEYTLLNRGAAPARLRFGSEWNLALNDPHFNRIGALTGARRFVITDAQADVRLEVVTSVPAGAYYFPVETVSDSERGLERTYQHLCLALFWDLALAPRRPWRVRLTQTVRSGGVHAAG